MGSLRKFLFSLVLLVGLHHVALWAHDTVEVAKENILHFTVDYGKFF